MKIKLLSEALTVQQKILEELLDLLECETRDLADVNVEAIVAINSKKEEAIARIQAYTASLRKVIGEAAVSLGLSVDISLGDLVANLGQQGNRDVLLQHEQLNKVAEHVRQVAAMNFDIAERFAASVTSSLELLTRVINQSNIYGAGGYQQRPAGAVLINREA